MDRLFIEGLTLYARHGVAPEERERGGIYSFDIELRGDFASAQDQLSETVDYMAVIRRVASFNQTHQFRLIESLAHALSDQLLHDFPPVRRAKVRVHKHPRAPWGLQLGGVAAEVRSERSDG